MRIWTKKLDELHLVDESHERIGTVCGRSMLGNNYAEVYKELDKAYGREPRKQCAKCFPQGKIE